MRIVTGATVSANTYHQSIPNLPGMELEPSDPTNADGGQGMQTEPPRNMPNPRMSMQQDPGDVGMDEDTVTEQESIVQPEGRRMTQLRYCLEKTVEKCCRLIKKSSVCKVVPRVYKKYPNELNQITEQMKGQLKKNMNDEIDKMLKEEDMVTLLNDLDEIVSENTISDGPKWRPTGNADLDLCSHVMPLKLKHKAQLQEILRQLEQQQEKLSNIYDTHLERLDAQRHKINNHGRYFEDLSKQCKNCLSSCTEDMIKVVVDSGI